MSKIFTSDRRLYSTFFPLLVVISAQAILALAVNLADNVMLGAYSERALSGAALANQLQFFLQQIIGGVAAGVVVLGSQYWGKGETEPIRRVIS
ncbi:MAG: MATE family efflux transporter, partial [Oscillospiraceae bacterium]|nr:MATE family efflux transporter [Oscillospiraceae bacterium]